MFLQKGFILLFSDETKLKLWNITNKNVLHLPTIFHHLPHLLSKENSLQPAVHVGQGRTGGKLCGFCPTLDHFPYLLDDPDLLSHGLDQVIKGKQGHSFYSSCLLHCDHRISEISWFFMLHLSGEGHFPVILE